MLPGRRRTSDAEQRDVESSLRDMPALELAMLRRSVGEMAAGCERCDRCHRTPLVGERVYVYESGKIRCELCRSGRREPPLDSRLVHSPEFGHAVRIKITDRRPAA
jgi:hypothetical protein